MQPPAGPFDASVMSRSSRGLPRQFAWRDCTHVVAAVHQDPCKSEAVASCLSLVERRLRTCALAGATVAPFATVP